MNGSSEEIKEKETYNIVTTIVHPGSPSTSANRNNEEENANLENGQTNNAFPLDLLQPPTPECSVKVPCDSDALKLSTQTDELNSKTCIRTAKSLTLLDVPGNDNNNEAKCCERKSSAPIAAVHSKTSCNSTREGINDKQSSANSSLKSTPRLNLLKNKVAPVSTENISIQIKTTGPEENETDAQTEVQTEGTRALSTTSFDSLADVCRICHDNPTKLQLMMPCRCKGSMGMVHLSCLERWLSESGKNTCEICGYEYNTTRRPKYTGLNAVCAWIRKPLSQNDVRNLFFDIACFFILTPLAAISSWLCVNGAQQYSVDHHFYKGKVVDANEPSNNTWTAIGLLSLTGTLVVAYMVWLFIAARYHTNVWREWQARNYVVTIIPFVEEEQNAVANQTSDEDSSEALHRQPNGTTNINSHASGQDSLMEPAQELNNNQSLCQLPRRSIESESVYGNTSDDEMVFASVYQRDSIEKILGSWTNLPEIHNYMGNASGGSHCNNQEDLASVINVDSITTNTVLLVANGQNNTTVGHISESTTESSNSSAETDN